MHPLLTIKRKWVRIQKSSFEIEIWSFSFFLDKTKPSNGALERSNWRKVKWGNGGCPNNMGCSIFYHQRDTRAHVPSILVDGHKECMNASQHGSQKCSYNFRNDFLRLTSQKQYITSNLMKCLSRWWLRLFIFGHDNYVEINRKKLVSSRRETSWKIFWLKPSWVRSGFTETPFLS